MIGVGFFSLMMCASILLSGMIKMRDERVNSKNEKLEEMLKTKGELESRIEREKKFQEEQLQEKKKRKVEKQAARKASRQENAQEKAV